MSTVGAHIQAAVARKGWKSFTITERVIPSADWSKGIKADKNGVVLLAGFGSWEPLSGSGGPQITVIVTGGTAVKFSRETCAIRLDSIAFGAAHWFLSSDLVVDLGVAEAKIEATPNTVTFTGHLKVIELNGQP